MKFCLCECHKLSTENVKVYYQGCKCGAHNCLTPYMVDQILEGIDSRLKSLENRIVLTEQDLNHVPSFACIEEINKLINGLKEWMSTRMIVTSVPQFVYENDVKNIYQRIDDLQKEILELKRFPDITHEKYKASINRVPHECPVCEGEGKNKNKLVMDGIKEPSTINLKHPACHACEGRGIVWDENSN